MFGKPAVIKRKEILKNKILIYHLLQHQPLPPQLNSVPTNTPAKFDSPCNEEERLVEHPAPTAGCFTLGDVPTSFLKNALLYTQKNDIIYL